MRIDINTLHWVCNAPSPYNDHLFRLLADTLPVRVQVHFTQEVSAVHHWTQNSSPGFPARRYRRHLGVDWYLAHRVCSDQRSLFLTNCWQDPTSQIILLVLVLTNRPYLIWNDTPSIRKRNIIKRHLRQAFLRLIFRRAFAVMGTGKPALAALAQVGCPLEKLVNFPYFIDLNRFLAADRCGANYPIVFGSCGRLHNDKGYDIALRALAGAFCGRSTDFRYLLAGTGPEAATLKKLSEELNIASRVEFVGWLDPKDLPRFYQGLDFFLHPARTEPYGVSVLEAMASGAVVIASDQTSAALDRIDNRVNGFLHASHDVNSLSRVIVQAIELTSGERERLRAAGRKTAEAWPTSRGVDVISQLLRDLQCPTARRLGPSKQTKQVAGLA